MTQGPLSQPKFDSRINALAFPLAGQSSKSTSVGLTRGYMRQYQPLPNYSRSSVIHYQYNPSTVSSDYNIADPSAQAALNFPNPGDTAQLAIPLSQTVSWSLMYDRTYELLGSYDDSGNTKYPNAAVNDPRVIGCEADVMQFKDFTGMLTNYSYGTASTSNLSKNVNYTLNQGIMQLVMAYAYFGSSGQGNNTQYFGYINEWSVQYTHFTQYNVPMRCVIAVYFTMMPPPAQNTTSNTAAGNNNWYNPNPLLNPVGSGGPPAPLTSTTTGKSGR